MIFRQLSLVCLIYAVLSFSASDSTKRFEFEIIGIVSTGLHLFFNIIYAIVQIVGGN